MTYEEFLRFVSSPFWWLSVLVAAIIANLITFAVKAALDRAFAAASTTWRVRRTAQVAKTNALIDELSKDPTDLIMASHRIVSGELKSAVSVIFAILATILAFITPEEVVSRPGGQITMLILALVFMMVGLMSARILDAQRRIMTDANRRRKSVMTTPSGSPPGTGAST